MSTTVFDPQDKVLTAALTSESLARGAEWKSRTTRNVLFGSAALIGAGGLAVALVIAAINHKADQTENLAALRDAWAKLPPLRVELNKDASVALREGGTVAMKDGTVELKQPAMVTLDPNAIVALDPDATVAVERPVGTATQTVPDLASQPTKTDDGDVIKREVTVFSSVEFGNGSIYTGWNYANGKAKVPTNQFCYFTHTKSDGSSERIELAQDRQSFPASKKLLRQFDEALSKCIWFGGAA